MRKFRKTWNFSHTFRKSSSKWCAPDWRVTKTTFEGKPTNFFGLLRCVKLGMTHLLLTGKDVGEFQGLADHRGRVEIHQHTREFSVQGVVVGRIMWRQSLDNALPGGLVWFSQPDETQRVSPQQFQLHGLRSARKELTQLTSSPFTMYKSLKKANTLRSYSF